MKKRTRIIAVLLAMTLLFGIAAFSAAAYQSSSSGFLYEQALYLKGKGRWIETAPGSHMYVCTGCGRVCSGLPTGPCGCFRPAGMTECGDIVITNGVPAK